ncbi:hypothetical protein HOP50_18g82230 [Chloropicon primus]|uniref:Uncharacterized protein n=1 Tax=Chloropicon primus TaxID=1764295 RepID=A0A5B8N0V5_9CHLO|nr:hypothetical protein A3770_18p82000 [Chloropicon primus]UPR04878.1 hypothetical protein HOP50_18g82230 [Chloropicon primus]|eukprot:QDZ25682.1 hypothetical protein A3770_18p82000 [Chloropicon primus]
MIEYLQWLIQKSYQPEQRDKASQERLTKINEGSKDLKEQWKMPVKTAFHWKGKRAQAKFAYDSQPGLKKMAGRRGPYEGYNLD